MNSSVPQHGRPAAANVDGGITLAESTGLALRNAVAPGPDWLCRRALAKHLDYFSSCGLPCLAGSSSRREAGPVKRRISHDGLGLPASPV